MLLKIMHFVFPVYIIWFIVHIYFFVTISSAQVTGGPDFLTAMGPVIISHIFIMFFGFLLMVYAIIDCALRKFDSTVNKVMWLVAIFVTNVLGAIAYFYIEGRKPRL